MVDVTQLQASDVHLFQGFTSSDLNESQSLIMVFIEPAIDGRETGTHSCVLQTGHMADRDPNIVLLLVLACAPPDTDTCYSIPFYESNPVHHQSHHTHDKANHRIYWYNTRLRY